MAKAEELLKIFNKSQELLADLQNGQSIIEELILENLHLKAKLSGLQTDLAPKVISLKEKELEEENKKLRLQVGILENTVSSVEKENREFIQRYVEIEKQNEGLANLYVASYQLHSTLDTQRVVSAIVEIMINLIGAEEFAIFTVNEDSTELILLGGELTQNNHRKKIPIGEDIEGQVALKRTVYRGDSGSNILISIPLEITVSNKTKNETNTELIGILSVYKLLNHKKNFTSLDYELLNLLAGQAATALLSARLYQGTERKLKTIEGFMNLLRQS
jgi:hypothetical protein